MSTGDALPPALRAELDSAATRMRRDFAASIETSLQNVETAVTKVITDMLGEHPELGRLPGLPALQADVCARMLAWVPVFRRVLLEVLFDETEAPKGGGR